MKLYSPLVWASFAILICCSWLPTNIHAQTLTTSNLPIIIINTEGGTINDEPGIVCSLSIINNASGINTVTDPANEYQGKAKVEYRGCSTQNYPKKPLGIELRSTTDVASSIDASLFGFPEESDWILNPSYVDKTFMRDVLAYYMANASGRYASRTKYVEVIINGSYQGIFVFEEKVKRDPGRVNVNKMDPTDLGNNSITGGYVVKIDKACGNYDPTHQWQSAYSSPGGTQKHYWMTDYPNDDNIVPQQFTYIKNYINAFEATMASSTYCSGYSAIIDDGSFIDYFLMEELSNNADAYRFSTYLSKERNSKGGKLSAGPVWDFNLAFGFLTEPFNGNTQSYQGWRYTAPGDPSFPVPFWWAKLLNCCNYNHKLVARYQQLRQTTWRTDTLMSFIDKQYALLNQGAFTRNFQKWPIIGISTWNDSPSYNGTTLQAEITYLKTWLTNRLNWMDSNISSFIQEPIATLSNDNPTINPGQSAQLTLTCTGTAPWTYTLSSAQSGTAASSPTTISVQPTQTTTYTLQAISNSCGTGLFSGSAIVTVVQPPADLSLALVSNRRVAAVGDTVAMSLLLTNDGPGTAYAVQLQNRLPNGMLFVGSESMEISQVNSIVTVMVDSIGAGQTLSYPYMLQLAIDGIFWNSAQVLATSTSDPDSQPGSGTGDGQDDMATIDLRVGNYENGLFVSPNPNQTPLPDVQSNQPPTNPNKADLSLAIITSSMIISPDQTISVSLIVSNRGGASANNVAIQTLLPGGWQLSDPAGLTVVGQTVTGTISSISVNSSEVLILAVQPVGNGTIQAQIATATPSDPDSTPGNGYTNGEDDEASVTLRAR